VNDLYEVPKIDLRGEERIAWACLAGLFLVISLVLAWRLSEAEKPPQPPAPEVPFQVLQSQIDALKQRADEQSKIRCLNVQTAKLDVAIFPVDNIGVRKVEKP
jgi:hypothetical protein